VGGHAWHAMHEPMRPLGLIVTRTAPRDPYTSSKKNWPICWW
jgi:hypothetical protein